jgi:tRNA splicing ligase
MLRQFQRAAIHFRMEMRLEWIVVVPVLLVGACYFTTIMRAMISVRLFLWGRFKNANTCAKTKAGVTSSRIMSLERDVF